MYTGVSFGYLTGELSFEFDATETVNRAYGISVCYGKIC